MDRSILMTKANRLCIHTEEISLGYFLNAEEIAKKTGLEANDEEVLFGFYKSAKAWTAVTMTGLQSFYNGKDTAISAQTYVSLCHNIGSKLKLWQSETIACENSSEIFIVNVKTLFAIWNLFLRYGSVNNNPN